MKGLITYVFRGILVSIISFYVLTTALNLALGERPTVYYSIEYFVSPTETIEGSVEKVELVSSETRKELLGRFSETKNTYLIKLNESPHEFFYSRSSRYPEWISPSFSKDDLVKISFHQNVIPWLKGKYPVVLDDIVPVRKR